MPPPVRNRRRRALAPRVLAPRVPPNGQTINTYLPMELLREIFLYSIESNQIKSGELVSVCRYWRSTLRCSRAFKPLIPLDGTTINTYLPMELLPSYIASNRMI